MKPEPLVLALRHEEGKAGDDSVELDALALLPAAPRALFVHAHGAGAGMLHAAQVAIAEALARRDIGTLRFNFPFMQAGRNRVDGRPRAVRTIGAALDLAAERYPDLPLWLSGHSFGGRMASHAAHEGLDVPVNGLVFGSFPLHPAGKPAIVRAAHLPEVNLPMLFLSGTRDALADAGLLQEVVAGLGERARLHWLDTADHGYRVLKRTRASSEDVFDEMARVAAGFIERPATT